MSDKSSQSKHWAGKDLRIIQSYWDSPPATQRSKWFVEQLKNYDFSQHGILEVGSFAGRNLRYIKEAFPNNNAHGVDVNKKAVEFARQKLPDVQFDHCNLFDLDSMNGVYDIVFTSGVLIHVPPTNLQEAVEKLRRKAVKYVMHIETLGKNEVSAGPKHLKPTYKVSDQIQWSPNLVDIYAKLGYNNTRILYLPDGCKTNGASELLIVEL